MLRITTRWLAALACMLLAACGNKGDLVRPPAPAEPGAPTAPSND